MVSGRGCVEQWNGLVLADAEVALGGGTRWLPPAFASTFVCVCVCVLQVIRRFGMEMEKNRE